MLIEFRVENFRSIKEEQVLSMEASGSCTELPDNIFEENESKLLKASAIYGANASGKSNLIKAIETMKMLVTKSANAPMSDLLPVTPFMFSRSTAESPSKFEIVFVHRGVKYQYGFSATRVRVIDEHLFAFPKKQPQQWFKRTYDAVSETTHYHWGGALLGEKERLRDRTRDDALFLSVATQWNHKQLTIVHDWFEDFLRIVSPGDPQMGLYTTQRLHDPMFSSESRALFQAFAIRFLKQADFGIEEFSFEEKDFENTLPFSMPPEVRKALPDEIKQRKFLQTNLHHRSSDSDKLVPLDLVEESDGTQRFFQFIGPWEESVRNQKTVIVDELDQSLHPHLTRNLVQFFQSTGINKSGAQLIFSTHDSTLLDNDLLRRDQIWLTEKDKFGSTSLYSLSEYSPRKGEALQKGYLSGRYGGIPITTFLEDNLDSCEEQAD